ncbi:cobQ/CobB/MinD/ParA nucleotide binding domain protein [Orientia tsutsugamushi str. Sido]|nr:cobQ/CobB/MinD/ParA nucleotide binding domain protein [Orientia tsutsugamushi str. Sido]
MSYNAQIIVIVNQKGGVGKTTTATNLATAFAATGKKTLLVDLDPQGNVGIGFGINKLSTDKSIYQVFVNHNINIPEQAHNIVQSLITPTIVPNLDIIISNMDLSATEIELVSQEEKESKLKSALSNIQSQYDYIIVDCLPSLGLLTLNALMAATQVIIPMQCEFLALVGLSQLLKIIDRFKKNFNPNLKFKVYY